MSSLEKANLEISRAKAEDAVALTELMNSAYRGESSRQGWTTEADILGGQRTDLLALQEIFDNPAAALFRAMLEGELVGCVLLEKKNQDVAYLGMLTVWPRLQGLGLGKQLLRHCEAWARDNWRTKKIEMTVFTTRSELIDWYCRHGYQATEEIRPFPMNDVRLGIPKREHLEFVVLEKKI